MNFFGKDVNNRYALWIALQALIVVDIILISISILPNFPKDIAGYIQIFDLIVCVILLIQWIITFYMSKPKKVFLKQKSNWIDLIASIPFELLIVFPQVGLLRYLRLLKLLRVMVLFNRFFTDLEEFFEKTSLGKILGGVIFSVIIFTVLLGMFGTSFGWFDDFYFVVVTLATVGYGDVAPQTHTEKVIAIVLIFVGLFVFSTITAAISSYFTDRLLGVSDKTIEDVISEELDEKEKNINEQLDDLKRDLELTHRENAELKEEIRELKELIQKD